MITQDDMMQLLQGRYSCRKYSDKPLTDEMLDLLAEASRIAPTAHNNQPQRMYVLRSPEALAAVAGADGQSFGAPLVLLFTYDRTLSYKRGSDGAETGDIDVAIVITQIILLAETMGLHSCWVRSFNPQKLREHLRALVEISENEELVALLPLGFAAENARPSRLHLERRERSYQVL